MDFRPVSNHLIDETVDYRIWLTSCSYTACPPPSPIAYITGISGASPASRCSLLAAWRMNVRRRSGHVASMPQAEHQQKCSLITRLTRSDSSRTEPRPGSGSPSDWSACEELKCQRQTPVATHLRARRPVVLCLLSRLMGQTGSSIYCCRRMQSPQRQPSQEVFVLLDLSLSGGGGPAALPAGLKVTQGTVKAAVDPNTKRLLSHLCFLSVPVVTHVFALSICQLVHVPPSAGAAAALSRSGVGAFRPGWLVCCDKRSSCPLTPLPHGAQPRRLLLDREIRE